MTGTGTTLLHHCWFFTMAFLKKLSSSRCDIAGLRMNELRMFPRKTLRMMQPPRHINAIPSKFRFHLYSLTALRSSIKAMAVRDDVGTVHGAADTFLTHIRSAVYCSNIVSYGHGFMLLRKAVNEYKWNLNFDGIALMWRGGCIIRSVFLGNIRNSFMRNPAMSHLLLDNFFKNAIVKNQQ
ncbi:hypothetical protein quinque_002427 [Culex quinquefasciatus]